MSDNSSKSLPMERIQYLFERYMSRSCTVAEERELAALSLLPEHEVTIAALEQEYWEKESDGTMTEEEAEKYLQRIMGAQPATVRRMNWRRLAIAASFILAIATGAWLLYFNRNEKPAITQTPEVKDIKPPAGNRAVITLANGEKVYLDSVSDGQLARQDNVTLMKIGNGQIVYNAAGSSNANEVQYNTLENPKGSKVIDMRLADGSRVWLNAGSSVTYPVAFIGNERKVSVTGEAYFEVAHNAAMPFRVSKGETVVTVLGTEFNVNAYDDEAAIRVTLLKGSVEVKTGSATALLNPGQQAQASDGIRVVNRVDLEEVMAWKNGRFLLKNVAIRDVMRQLEKWYDVSVVYKGDVKELFIVDMDRNTNMSDVFKVLEATGGVRFTIEGRKITVMP